MTAGLACVSSQTWGNLKALVVDPTVRGRYESKPRALLEETQPWAPFGHQDWTAHALARASIEGKPIEQAVADFIEKRVNKYRTPVAEWLHSELRPVFMDQWPDDDAFAAEFDRAEVMLGVLAQDATEVRISAQGRGWGQSLWFGRSVWRASRYGDVLEDLQEELATEGTSWGPLRAGLFGGNLERAKTARTKYAEQFGEIARQSRF